MGGGRGSLFVVNCNIPLNYEKIDGNWLQYFFPSKILLKYDWSRNLDISLLWVESHFFIFVNFWLTFTNIFGMKKFIHWLYSRDTKYKILHIGRPLRLSDSVLLSHLAQPLIQEVYFFLSFFRSTRIVSYFRGLKIPCCTYL